MPTHTPSERRKRAGQAAAAAAGAVVGGAVGGVARGGSRAAAGVRRAAGARRLDPGSVVRPGELAGGRVLDPGSTIRAGELRAARGAATQAMTAKQAGAIQPPHNSPAMSSFKNVGGISGRHSSDHG